MSTAITVENLSKKYIIRHQKQPRYATLRDVVSSSARALAQRVAHPFTVREDSRTHEEFWALKDVSFNIRQGDRIGVIGRNGAGKSTLLKVLSRITEPTAGRIRIKGRVASLLEVGTGFNPELTGRENIFLNGAILGMSKAEIKRKFDEIVAFAEVEKFLDTPVKHYSSGMYVRLAFAVAAHLEPEILIVDEVLAVGDIKFRTKCLGKMQDIGQSGRTIIFVSHDMSVVRRLCGDAILLQGGKVSQSGSSDEVTGNYEKFALAGTQEMVASADRSAITDRYCLERVELRNATTGIPTVEFQAGDTMDIHLWTNADAPQDSFTVEYFLSNERGDRISYGSANPVRDRYFHRQDRHFVCRLGPLPLTSGRYYFQFSVRVWGLERWDTWDNAISFLVTRCDPFKTDFDVPNGAGGDFVITQDWWAERL